MGARLTVCLKAESNQAEAVAWHVGDEKASDTPSNGDSKLAAVKRFSYGAFQPLLRADGSIRSPESLGRRGAGLFATRAPPAAVYERLIMRSLGERNLGNTKR